MSEQELHELVKEAGGTGHKIVAGFKVSGKLVFFGVIEYTTPDGWAGLRQPLGRLDEVPMRLLAVDPT